MSKEQLKVPKLRFKEFSGEWEEKKIIDIADYVDYRGKTPSKTSEGVFLVTAKNIKNGKIDYEISKEYISSEDYQEVMRRGIPKIGDILITTEAPLGEIAQIDNENIALAQRVIKYRMKGNKAINSYVKHFFISPFFQKKLEEKSSGQTVKGIKGSILHQLEISITSLPEQQKIADFLSKVDEKIEKLTKKKELLEQYKKGVMQKIFSQELRFKDENGNDFPEWEEKELGEVAEFLKGKNISKSDISEFGIECIRYGELYTHYKEKIINIISKTNIDIENLVFSKANDIIIPSSGETSIDIATASCVMKDGVALGGDLNIIRTKQNGVFLSFYLNNVKKLEIANLAQGNSVVHLYSNQLKTLKINLPKIEEQQKIADFLSVLDKKIDIASQELAGVQEFKKGLLQQMFV